jgi:cytochrome d ubiquinol oxidase subunit II
MDDHHLWSSLSALAALAGVMAYALFGGADFGGGVWDVLAWGERKKQQRLAVQRAMGPVWEANHVWLILVVVVLFTCFPRGYSALSIALFIPFHLALFGIILRGASFVFRSHQSRHKDAAAETSAWGIVFGVASVISPILLGIAFGVVTEGGIRVEQGQVVTARFVPWLSPYCVANGLLALSACAYLAAVYLTNETVMDLEVVPEHRRIG